MEVLVNSIWEWVDPINPANELTVWEDGEIEYHYEGSVLASGKSDKAAVLRAVKAFKAALKEGLLGDLDDLWANPESSDYSRARKLGQFYDAIGVVNGQRALSEAELARFEAMPNLGENLKFDSVEALGQFLNIQI